MDENQRVDSRGRGLRERSDIFLLQIWPRVNFAPEAPVPFTDYPGFENVPTFSPDGSQIAFAWSGDPAAGLKGADLYVKAINSENLLRLTQHPSDSFVRLGLLTAHRSPSIASRQPVWQDYRLPSTTIPVYISFLRWVDPKESCGQPKAAGEALVGPPMESGSHTQTTRAPRV